MHVMLRRAAVSAGALSALLGLGTLPAQAAPSHRTDRAAQAAPAAVPWQCGAQIARADGNVGCPALGPGRYAFKNVGDGGSMYVHLCPAGTGCAVAPAGLFYLTNGSSQTWDLPAGWDVLISSPYAAARWTAVQATPVS
jgi:hypothetical protein